MGEQRFQRRVYYLRSVSKRPLPHFRLGNQIDARRSPPSPGSMPRMALALADACIKVNRKRLDEIVAMMGLYTPHLTPAEEESAWIKAVPEAQVKLPLISIEATRP